MNNILEMPDDFIRSMLFLDMGDTVKVAFQTSVPCYAFADLGGERYREDGNDVEPFHFKDHIFLFPKELLSRAPTFTVTFRPGLKNSVFKNIGDIIISDFTYQPELLRSYEDELSSMDRGLSLNNAETKELSQGISYAIEHYETADGEPVVVHSFVYDATEYTMICGTPQGTYDYRNQKETVMSTANYELGQGKDVLAAFNADFFDMHGDCAPSGLCVKDGVIVANPQSERYFFAVTKSGRHIIDTLAGNPHLISEIDQAVCGLNLLLENGNVNDVAAGELFGTTPHPRTVVGLTEDGRVVILVIDGRRPWHSNGATLYECAMLLKDHGAVRGVNLDGGGSSTFIVKNDEGELEMLNHPADLHRPFENLIRDVFDSILIIKK